MIVVCFDAVCQGVAAPASGYGLQNIEDRLIDIFAFGDDFNMMTPWNAGEDIWKISSLFLYVVGMEIFSRNLCEFPGFIAVELIPLLHPP